MPVTVRVWKMDLAKGRVGHASVETPEHYMSFWPTGAADGAISQFFQQRTSASLTYEDDLKQEESEPDVVIKLSKLDTDAMNKKYLELSSRKWAIFGESKIVSAVSQISTGKSDDTDSCASMALKVLEAGGIRKLLDFKERVRIDAGLPVVPDFIADLAKHALANEEKIHSGPDKKFSCTIL